jgi:hypothetical protein
LYFKLEQRRVRQTNNRGKHNLLFHDTVEGKRNQHSQ